MRVDSDAADVVADFTVVRRCVSAVLMPQRSFGVSELAGFGGLRRWLGYPNSNPSNKAPASWPAKEQE